MEASPTLPPLSPNAHTGASSSWNRWSMVVSRKARETNPELWILLSIFGLAWLLNVATEANRAVLSLYVLPTVASAYCYGRRHAVLTALGSVLLVVLLAMVVPGIIAVPANSHSVIVTSLELLAWAGVLLVTAYLMGTLYEHRSDQIAELRETYNGILVILRHFLSNDTYTENHCYRVSVYSARIAAELRLTATEIEDVRAAGLLHDIGKLRVSRTLLHKAAKLTQDEFDEMKTHVEHAASLLEPAGGALRRVLPLVLAHHERYDGSGYHQDAGDNIPLGSRVIAVADVYDSLLSDRPYRKGVSSFEARAVIEKGAGTEFDPNVVAAFTRLFQRNELDLILVSA